MMRIVWLALCAVLAPVVLSGCSEKPATVDTDRTDAGLVVVYTSIDEARMTPVYQGFSRKTGIRVQQITAANDRLLEMMRDKRRSPPADLFVADGAGALARAANEDVFRPTYAGEIDSALPVQFREADGLWFGFATKATVLVLNSFVEQNAEPDSYESLAEDYWRGRICLTSSSLAENTILIAALIERHGKREAELVVRRLISNLAAPVFDESKSLLSAVRSGQCDAAITRIDTNTFPHSGSSEARAIVPSAASGGALLDVVGAGVTRHAGNPAAAREFLLWLASENGQRIFAESNLALPAIGLPEDFRLPGVTVPLEPSDIGVARLGALHQDAIDLAERAQYP